MILCKFILANIEQILSEWETFAKTIPAAAAMDTAALRDDAENILTTIAFEMEGDQSASDQEIKSQGKAARTGSMRETSAEVHSSGRLDANFNLNEMVSEYRALRATVIRLWTRDLSSLDGDALYDLTRFNEGIDQALTESVAQYTALRDRSIREGDKRKDEFLATLAHELRNPLAPLRNALHIVRSTNSDPTGASMPRGMLPMMERQVDQMVRLVDDLLDVARITRGKLELRIQTTDVATVVNNALETCAPLVTQYGHELRVLVPDQPLYIQGDATRLAQVVCNLISNAAKYTNAHGHIDLTVEPTGKEIVLTVKDNGMGIPAEMLGSVFDMFSQVNRSREHSQSGLGIGLALSRQIVEMHGGTIQASSQGIECGSSFFVRLPQSSGLPTSVEPTRDTTIKGLYRMKILIADDNRDAADTLGMLLRVHGHEVHVMYNGCEAINTAPKLRPDVILLDLGMPEISGFDAAKSIRQQAWASSLVLIAVTGWGQPADRQRSKDSGFDFHLVKPIDPDKLENLLNEVKTKTAH